MNDTGLLIHPKMGDTCAMFDEAPLRALFLPTERAPTIDELKRALLSFDEVHLLHPDDREIIDPAAFIQASSGGMMPMGMSGGSVLPLPKARSYDDDFGRVTEDFDKQGAAGALVIKRCPTFIQGGIIGNVPVPEGWPNHVWTLGTFRQLASDKGYLTAAAKSLTLWKDDLEQLGDILPENPMGVVTSNVLPELATLGWGDHETGPLLSYLAAARLGNFVKVLGMCEMQGFSPFSTDPGADSVMALVGQALRQVTDHVEDSQPTLAVHVSLVQSILLQDVLDHKALSSMTVAQVVRERNRAWGKAQRERARFLKQVAKMAAEATSREVFSQQVTTESQAYLKARADLAHPWMKIGTQAGLLVGSGVLAEAAAGTLRQTLFPTTLSVALGVGAAVLAFGAKVSSQVLDVMKQQRELGATPGAALVTPYRFVVQRESP